MQSLCLKLCTSLFYSLSHRLIWTKYLSFFLHLPICVLIFLDTYKVNKSGLALFVFSCFKIFAMRRNSCQWYTDWNWTVWFVSTAKLCDKTLWLRPIFKHDSWIKIYPKTYTAHLFEWKNKLQFNAHSGSNKFAYERINSSDV